jgi:hypothetical protein
VDDDGAPRLAQDTGTAREAPQETQQETQQEAQQEAPPAQPDTDHRGDTPPAEASNDDPV